MHYHHIVFLPENLFKKSYEEIDFILHLMMDKYNEDFLFDKSIYKIECQECDGKGFYNNVKDLCLVCGGQKLIYPDYNIFSTHDYWRYGGIWGGPTLGSPNIPLGLTRRLNVIKKTEESLKKDIERNTLHTSKLIDKIKTEIKEPNIYSYLTLQDEWVQTEENPILNIFLKKQQKFMKQLLKYCNNNINSYAVSLDIHY